MPSAPANSAAVRPASGSVTSHTIVPRTVRLIRGGPGRAPTIDGFPESHRDLLDAQVATIATIDGDGFSQQTEVWFLHDGGELGLSLNTSHRKVHDLERRPQCSLFLLDPANPDRYLEVRRSARLDPDADGACAAKVGAKYGADLRQYDQRGERRVVVTIEPTRIRPVTMR